MSLNLIPHTATPLSDLLTRAAFAPIENVGWIRVTGSDRIRWLNGMVTNNIADLKPGQGNYNFFLNAQGRIQGDATAWMLEDSILLETAADRIPALIELLDRFIIMDDVALAPLHDYYGVLLAGPRAEEFLALAGLPVPEGSGLHHITLPEDDNGNPFEIIRADATLVPRFEVWCYDLKRDGISSYIGSKLNTPEATPGAVNQLRILSGTPLYGVDIRDKDLPQETNQTRALHFSKGCYLGQEIVERIRSRGAVHRTFTGFLLEGTQPEPGTTLQSEDKTIGELTSVAHIGSSQIALGYVRREALEQAALDKKTTLTYSGGIATPAALPFHLPEMSA